MPRLRATPVLALSLALALSAGCRPLPAQATSPPSPIDRETAPLLSAERIAALPDAQREAWTRYLETSRRDQARDRALLEGEMRARGIDRMTRAPYAARFEVEPWMTEAWFRGDTARALAEAILSYQTPSGGWSKRVDFAAGPRAPGQSFFSESDGWHYIATLDNGGTTEEMRFLARAFAARGDARYRDAFLRGLAYLHRAQLPTGCWPQVYPLQGGYHDAATFNDEVTIHAAELLAEVARGELDLAPAEERTRAAEAVSRAVGCIVASQVVVAGRRTVWGQQHDPLTLAPVAARSYEPVALASKESAAIVRFLVSLPDPDPAVVEAVYAAAEWFRPTRVFGYTYGMREGRRAEAGAGPLWARLYQIGTNRPVFSNRDGVVLYDYERLTDRRTGYAWYTDDPADALRAVSRWAARHPAPAAP